MWSRASIARFREGPGTASNSIPISGHVAARIDLWTGKFRIVAIPPWTSVYAGRADQPDAAGGFERAALAQHPSCQHCARVFRRVLGIRGEMESTQAPS